MQFEIFLVIHMPSYFLLYTEHFYYFIKQLWILFKSTKIFIVLFWHEIDLFNFRLQVLTKLLWLVMSKLVFKALTFYLDLSHISLRLDHSLCYSLVIKIYIGSVPSVHSSGWTREFIKNCKGLLSPVFFLCDHQETFSFHGAFFFDLLTRKLRL